MYKKLVSFDFDSTLIHTPNAISGREEWEKKMKMPFPSNGWWGNKESLNTSVFYIPVNQWVYNQYEKYINDDDAYVFVATGRIKRLESHVKKILSMHNINCDLYCCTGRATFDFKCDLFRSLIDDNPTAKELIMFDDRHDHITEFVKWARFQPIKITIIDVINKKIVN